MADNRRATQRLIDDLRDLPATVNPVDYRQRGYHLEVRLPAGRVRACARLLRERVFYLAFVSAVHLAPVMEIIYQLACFARPCRLILRVPLEADGLMPTIADIFHGANWHERETRDMFGVVFSGHPYLEPLLLAEEDADLKPLLKGAAELKTAAQLRPVAPPAGPETAAEPEGQP